MQTFFIDESALHGDELLVGGEVAHHIGHVLRLRPGEAVRFSDGAARYYEGTIAEVTKKTVRVALSGDRPIDDEAKLEVTLIQCLPRGDKLEQVLQKTTELGVKRVIPVESDNSQIRLKDKKAEKRERWQKIVAAAAEQCGRGIVPRVETACSLREAMALLDDRTEVIFCYERENQTGLKTALAKIKGTGTKVALVIGPEGGFSETEAAFLADSGARCVTLGRRILRTETAGPAVLAALMYEFGEWEGTD